MKDWIIGSLLAVRSSDVKHIKITYENETWQATAYSHDGEYLCVLAINSSREELVTNLDKILN